MVSDAPNPANGFRDASYVPHAQPRHRCNLIAHTSPVHYQLTHTNLLFLSFYMSLQMEAKHLPLSIFEDEDIEGQQVFSNRPFKVNEI